MNKSILSCVLLLGLIATSSADAHWGHWHGGWGGHWHGGGWGGHWHGGGWGGGYGWGSSYWPRRSTVYYSSYPSVYYSSPVIYGGGYYGRGYYDSGYYGGGCGWYGNAGAAYPGYVVAPAPAVYSPAGIAYGPDAVKEFMGVDRDFAKGPLVASRAPLVVSAPVSGARVVADEPKTDIRVASHPEAKARAARYISTGDAKFGVQLYYSAAQRYREAVVAAPDVADAHFRQGFAYIASNKFDLAAKSFRRGLEIDPLWVNSSFRLDDLYGRNRLAKDSHLEGLAKLALADRSNADNLFLIGLMLHCDGQTERAKKFFTHAEKQAAGDDAHIQAFLVPPAPAVEDAV